MSFNAENILASGEVQVERKHYFIEVRENSRGKFLKIVEEAHGRRNCVIVPSTGIDEFMARLSRVVHDSGASGA